MAGEPDLESWRTPEHDWELPRWRCFRGVAWADFCMDSPFAISHCSITWRARAPPPPAAPLLDPHLPSFSILLLITLLLPRPLALLPSLLFPPLPLPLLPLPVPPSLLPLPSPRGLAGWLGNLAWGAGEHQGDGRDLPRWGCWGGWLGRLLEGTPLL